MATGTVSALVERVAATALSPAIVKRLDLTVTNDGGVLGVPDATLGAADIADGAVTTDKLADAAVTSAKLGNGAGVAALLAAGLGASISYLSTKNNTTTLLASHASKDRAILVVVTVDEALDDGTGTQPTFSIGETTTGVAAFAPTSAFVDAAAGTVFVFGGKNLATKNITVTGVQAVGDATGGITVAVLAIPTT